jgi:hypothetical protein
LERHTHRSGKDTVDHGRGGHDDHANVVCGVLRTLSNDLGYNDRYHEWIEGTGDDRDGRERDAWQRLRLRAHLHANGMPLW